MKNDFSVEIESYYLPDTGTKTDVFSHISQNHSVETLDFVEPGEGEGVFESDPKLFVSSKTKRGPLKIDWLETARQNISNGIEKEDSYFCSYKLITVNCKMLGVQNRLERFIHESMIRKMLNHAHRQAWCWMDDWCELSIEDIRRQEKLTMQRLYNLYHGGEMEDSEELTWQSCESE